MSRDTWRHLYLLIVSKDTLKFKSSALLSGVSSLKEDLLCCCNNMDTHLTTLLMQGKASETTLKHSKRAADLHRSPSIFIQLQVLTHAMHIHKHTQAPDVDLICQMCVYMIHSSVAWSNGQPFGRPVFILHTFINDHSQLKGLATYT